jgi:Protein of unknown function (DUF3048) N-terminal domain/Protein of unknown function (DUF3048) C-terminal domain
MPIHAKSRTFVPVAALVTVMALLGGVTAACGEQGGGGAAGPKASRTPSKSPSETPSPTPTRTRSGAPGLAKDVSPFTGQRVGTRKPVLAVKIDNVRQARPATGLARADLVYVEPVEAGLGRILAVFSSRLPSSVGPIRSARESDLELLRQFRAPAFAYSGAQTRLLPWIRREPLHDVSPAHAGAEYFRGDSKPAPHNLYARPGDLLDEAPKASRARDIGFRFGAAPAGGRSAGSPSVSYGAFEVGFRWSASADRFLVSMDGEPMGSADGTPPRPATVVIQYVTIRPSRFGDKFGSITPYTESVGSGKALVLRDGRAFDARWVRKTSGGGTTFTTANGKPLTFATGQTWVVFAKKS